MIPLVTQCVIYQYNYQPNGMLALRVATYNRQLLT